MVSTFWPTVNSRLTAAVGECKGFRIDRRKVGAVEVHVGNSKLSRTLECTRGDLHFDKNFQSETP